MDRWAEVKDILNDMEDLDRVLDVSLISRAGRCLAGNPPSGSHHETFAAMVAIIIGAAETTSAELKENLARVKIELTRRDVILIEIGTKYLLSLTTEKELDDPLVMDEIKEGVSRIKDVL